MRERLATRNKLVQDRLDALEQDLTGKFQQRMAGKVAGHPVDLRDLCVMFFRKEFGGNGPELLEQMVNDLGVHAKKAMSGELTGSEAAENSGLPPALKRQSSLSNPVSDGQREIPRRDSIISRDADEDMFHDASDQIAPVSKETAEAISFWAATVPIRI